MAISPVDVVLVVSESIGLSYIAMALGVTMNALSSIVVATM